MGPGSVYGYKRICRTVIYGYFYSVRSGGFNASRHKRDFGVGNEDSPLDVCLATPNERFSITYPGAAEISTVRPHPLYDLNADSVQTTDESLTGYFRCMEHGKMV